MDVPNQKEKAEVDNPSGPWVIRLMHSRAEVDLNLGGKNLGYNQKEKNSVVTEVWL